MTDTSGDNPQILWLKGNELVIASDGLPMPSYGPLISMTMPLAPKSLSFDIRHAIAILPSTTLPSAQRMTALIDSGIGEKVTRRITKIGEDDVRTVQGHVRYPYMWNDEMPADSIIRMQNQTNTDISKVQRTLRKIAENPQKWRDEVTPAIPAGQLIKKDYVSTSSDYSRLQKIIEQQPVFTAELQEFLARDMFPVSIVSKQLNSDGTMKPPGLCYIAGSATGLVFSQPALEVLIKQQDGGFDLQQNIARGTIFAVASSLGLSPEMIGFENRDFRRRVTKEFNDHVGSVLGSTQLTNDSKVSGNYSAGDMIAAMHFAFTSGLRDPAAVRAELPESSRMYDQFMDAVRRRIEERKQEPLQPLLLSPEREAKTPVGRKSKSSERPPVQAPEPPIVPTSPVVAELPPALVPEPKPVVTPPPVSERPLVAEPEQKIIPKASQPKRPGFNPTPFSNSETQYERECSLIEAVVPFIDNALAQTPPYNQFRCRLILSDGNTRNDFPIHLTLRNEDGKDMQFKVFTGTGNIDEAIELKKMLQSHVLNHEGIRALYLGPNDVDVTRQIEAFVPHVPPESAEVVKAGNFYAASFRFSTERRDSDIHFPLGVKFAGPQSNKEAERRLDIIEKHLEELRKASRWETAGEVTQHLKRHVIASGGRWDTALKEKLDYYGEADRDLHFPADGSQKTTLTYATLVLHENGAEYNPYWQLRYTLKVDQEGQKPSMYELSMNLHTTDAVAAQLRGAEAIDALGATLASLGKQYPDLHWKNDLSHSEGKPAGRLQLQRSDGSLLQVPLPQNLSDIESDLPNPKLNFHVIDDIQHTQDGQGNLTLSVKRGVAADGDLMDFNDRSRSPLQRRFSVSNPDAVEPFVANVTTTFNRFLRDAYSNRTREGMRKTRQTYRTATIENLFNKAVVQALGETAAIEESTSVQWSGTASVRGRS